MVDVSSTDRIPSCRRTTVDDLGMNLCQTNRLFDDIIEEVEEGEKKKKDDDGDRMDVRDGNASGKNQIHLSQVNIYV